MEWACGECGESVPLMKGKKGSYYYNCPCGHHVRVDPDSKTGKLMASFDKPQ